MVTPVKNTKFDEYLEFPCAFTFKVMGLANVELSTQVISVIQNLAPGDYSPKVTPSSKGTYESVTLSVTVISKEHIEEIYTQVGSLEHVRYVL